MGRISVNGPWLDVGCWVLAVGYWVLGIGYWLLDVGCWLLGIGCWLLAVGFWRLAVGELFGISELLRQIKGTGGLGPCVCGPMSKIILSLISAFFQVPPPLSYEM